MELTFPKRMLALLVEHLWVRSSEMVDLFTSTSSFSISNKHVGVQYRNIWKGCCCIGFRSGGVKGHAYGLNMSPALNFTKQNQKPFELSGKDKSNLLLRYRRVYTHRAYGLFRFLIIGKNGSPTPNPAFRWYPWCISLAPLMSPDRRCQCPCWLYFDCDLRGI